MAFDGKHQDLMTINRILKISLGVFFSLLVIALLSSPGLALLGDIDLNDLVDTSDLSAISQDLGAYQTDPGFNRFLDLNIDNSVDVEDMAIAGRSFGSTRNFHYPRQISNTGSSVILLSSCIDASDRIHIAWSESSNVYYTRLDRFGNTLIDDLLLEHGSNTGDSGVAIGCDDQGNSHMIWDCRGSVGGTCQARIDRYGYLVVKGRLDTLYPPVSWPAVDLDSSGRAHMFYTKHTAAKTVYTVVDPDGKVQISQQIIPKAQRYHELVVDRQDNAHLLYAVYTDTHRLAYQRIGVGATPSLPQRTIGVLGWEGGINDSIRSSLAVDSDLNVFASYFTFSTFPQNLYLEKLDPDGNTVIDGRPILPEYDNGANGGAQTDIALDSNDNLHMVSFTDFAAGFGTAHTAYGIFDNDANPLQPVRMVIYGQPVLDPTLLLDSHADAQVVYKAGNTSGYPPCGDYNLCYQGTSFEPGAYNLSLPDLGSDLAHLSWDPFMLRWNAPLVITGTVFNAGWSAAAVTTIRVSVAITDTDIVPLASADVAVPALSPYQSYQFTANLNLPHSPPSGFEGLKFLRLKLDVDPGHLIAETTETNNHTSSPVPIEPVPTQTRLYAVIRDDTYTVLGGAEAAEYASTGRAYIEGSAYPNKGIDVTGYSTVLASDIPVSDALVSYTVTWRGQDYRNPPPVQIGVRRNAGDPYKIDFTPANTAVMVTDRWASLSGKITREEDGTALPNAYVRLQGQGLSIEAVTDSNGNYASPAPSALARLIPGDYQVRISRAGYARLTGVLTIGPLEARLYDRAMVPTEFAYLHGSVINEFGNSVPGAAVDACGTVASTDDQGVFDLEVKADCTGLIITRLSYADYPQSLSLTAGLETLLNDMTMVFDPPVYVVGGGDRVASRVIDVSTGGMLPDAPADAGFALTKLYEKFKDEFWIDYRILILYGCYEYNLSAAYVGAPGDYHLQFAQVSLAPKTFEIHMSLGSVDFLGVTIPIPIVSDSGMRTALYGIETRLVNTDTGRPIKTVRTTLEGGGSWVALKDATRTYDFSGAPFTDRATAEVWFYLKAGLNDGGIFDSPPQLDKFNQQILKLDLSTGDIYGSYELGSFPLP